MHCEHCERKVKEIVESITGVESAKPNAKKGLVKIGLSSNSPADEATIRAELEAGGYPAE